MITPLSKQGGRKYGQFGSTSTAVSGFVSWLRGVGTSVTLALGLADLCDTFYVRADSGFVVVVESGFTCPVDQGGFAVSVDNTTFTVPACPSPT